MSSYTDAFSIRGIFRLICGFPLMAYFYSILQDWAIAVVSTGPIPKHIAFVMDGNRRYAKLQNVALEAGHSAGAETLLNILDICYRLGVEHVTIYAFSIENFNRSKQEVDTLFGLLRDKLQYLTKSDHLFAKFNQVKIRIIGNKSYIPRDILRDLDEVEAKTCNVTGNRVLNVCFPYTSRDDMTHAITTVVQKKVNQEIDHIDVETIKNNMYMGEDSPDLDIFIRTSGQYRLSDFMLWQVGANCTIEFVNSLWPDFNFFDLMIIILKWSYTKTIEVENNLALGLKPNADNLLVIKSILDELPQPPPFHSVNQRD